MVSPGRFSNGLILSNHPAYIVAIVRRQFPENTYRYGIIDKNRFVSPFSSEDEVILIMPAVSYRRLMKIRARSIEI